MRILLLAIFMCCGCDVRQTLDLGSAKAIIELQQSHNDLLKVVQADTNNDAKEGNALRKEFPDNFQLQETGKESERIAERAAAIAKVERDPYASLGPFSALLEKINWLLSEEGLLYIATILGSVLGVGGVGTALRATGKAKRAHKADPSTPYAEI